MPSFQKNVQYLPIKDIDFTSAKTKKRKLDDAIDTKSTVMPISQSAPKQTSPVATVTDANISAFYDTLATCGTKPALLSIIPKFSSNYVPKRLLDEFSWASFNAS